jgi:methylmalonyl-CoA carboxyltransferase small subunit
VQKGPRALKLRITIDGKTYAADVEMLQEDEGERMPGSEQPTSDAEADPAPGAYRPIQSADGHSADEKLYRSPVTGLVIKVNVKPGEMVRSGEVMLVLEAMKMETSVTAHHEGRVKSVHITGGEPVKLHQILIELE